MENDSMDEKQKEAFNLMISGKSFFLSGAGGVGKSYVLAKGIEFLKMQGKHVVVCGSTKSAAVNLDPIEGITVYKLLNTYPQGLTLNEAAIKRLLKSPATKADTIIIDEISMIDQKLFTYLVSSLIYLSKHNHNKKYQLILVGDFYQLPPVAEGDEEPKYAFESPYWSRTITHSVLLKTPHRQADKEFVSCLLDVREAINKEESVHWIINHCHYLKINHSAVFLVPRREDAAAINIEKLALLPGKSRVFSANRKGPYIQNESNRYEKSLELKIGARVMTTINKNSYYNGAFGTVVRMEDDCIWVELDPKDNEERGAIVKVERNIWRYAEEQWVEQFPIILAYSITIHKAQGCTLDSANISPECFATGQLYVALSRVKSVENLYIMTPLLSKYIKCDPKIKDFYRMLELQQSKTA